MLSAEGLSVTFWCRLAWIAIVGALLVTMAAIPGANDTLALVVDISLLAVFAVANFKISEYNDNECYARRLSGANSE